MSDALLLLLHTAHQRYTARRADVLTIELFAGADAPAPSGPPRIYAALAALLGAPAAPAPARQRALLVPVGRRLVALLVDGVETLEGAAAHLPLPPLLARRLQPPWAVGARMVGDALLVQLDLRAVAHSALRQKRITLT